MRNTINITLLLFGAFIQVIAQSNYSDLTSKRVSSDSTITWEQVGPGNAGFANLMRYHPTVPGKVFQCPDMWNAYQSDDNGLRWYGVTDYDGDGDFYHIRDMNYSPSDPEVALAVGGSHLFHSTDTGRTWEIVKNCPWYNKDSNGEDAQAWRKKVGALGIDPNNSNTWFVAGGSFVRGQEWLSCYSTVTASAPRGITSNIQNIGKLWRTTNGGASWRTAYSGLNAAAQVGRIIVNPTNSNQVFLASNYGVYRSETAGLSWKQISSGKLESDIIMDMDYYYNESTGKFILYVIDQVQYLPNGQTTKCQGGVFKSEDNGDTWTKINGNLGLDFNRLSGNAPNNYYKFIATWLEITEAEAKATYPQLPTSGLQFYNMLSVDQSREDALYLGFPDPQVANSFVPGRLWTTSNGGETWVNTARLYEHVWENDKAYWEERGNPWHENMVVGHQSPHMQSGNNYALRSMRGLAVGADGSVMIISDHSTMLSTDYGVTWNQVDEDYTESGGIVGRGNSNLPALTIGQDKRNDHMVLGSGEHYAWIPTDDSPNEYQAMKYSGTSQPTVIALSFDPYNSKIVYGTSSRQENKQHIFRSTDTGATWSQWGIATPATNKWLDDFYTNALTIDPIDPNYMYHGITEIVDEAKGGQGGFFVSSNQGKSFVQSNNGLPNPVRARDIQFDPRDNTRKSLFLAAEYMAFDYHSPLASGGLYHSANRGASWNKVTLPSGIKGVNKIRFDHTNRMYITTGYRGSGNGVWYSDNYGASWTQVFKYEGAECFAISPFDHNFLAVTVKYLAKNPGVFISRDRGLTWAKTNIGLVTPHQIEDIEFLIDNPSEIWCAALGTGFYKGRIKNGEQSYVVNIIEDNIDYYIGTNTQLTAEIIQPSYAASSINWKSANPGIATVDQNGLVTPVGKGKTKIWATTENGRFSDYAVFVVHEVDIDSIAFNKKEITLNVEESEQMEVSAYPTSVDVPNLAFMAFDTDIATVNNSGLVQAEKGGTTKVVAYSTSDNSLSDTVLVHVNEVFLDSIKIDRKVARLFPGVFFTFSAEAYPADAYNTDINWKTINPTIAVMFSSGKVYTVKNGETKVVAYNDRSNVSDTCLIQVGDYTAVSSVDTDAISIYPTLATSSFEIFGVSGYFSVSIFTLSGKKLQETFNKSNVDISDLKPGAYFAKIAYNNTNTTIKVIKQ